jgi:hypothetical protein
MPVGKREDNVGDEAQPCLKPNTPLIGPWQCTTSAHCKRELSADLLTFEFPSQNFDIEQMRTPFTATLAFLGNGGRREALSP